VHIQHLANFLFKVQNEQAFLKFTEAILMIMNYDSLNHLYSNFAGYIEHFSENQDCFEEDFDWKIIFY
jgi:hypothetical protein